jgi:hypothetical protein
VNIRTAVKIIMFLSLIFFMFICEIEVVHLIQCKISWGQRGTHHSSHISWRRNCPRTGYCFEASTTDITKVKRLFDFPWNEYYYQYYIRGCGGDYGTPELLTSKPMKVNITAEKTVTGHGGSAVFDLQYACHSDFCSGLFYNFFFFLEKLINIIFKALCSSTSIRLQLFQQSFYHVL